ncbi:MAG: MAPEG family protein [Deltaproteobacteria bacterium]|nr:MAPEG family protein [Deltaproteobacteria bacterium]MDD9827399.1 MAPEG family protein [Deltaproteobacteria bacterium]
MAEAYVSVWITTLYTVLLGILMVAMQIPLGRLRSQTGISMFHGDNPELAVAMRRFGNFTEHVPFLLILMALVELQGGSPTLLHICGVVLLGSRIAHPIGLKFDSLQSQLRLVGAAGTLLVAVTLLIAAALSLR